MNDIVPVILCGGVGSRLWPLSRASLPKPFSSLLGSESLFQSTLTRNNFLQQSPLVVCGEQHRFLVQEELERLGVSGKVILEPSPRNTAPAAALAAFYLLTNSRDPVLLISPSDHLIQDLEGYQIAIAKGVRLAESGSLVVFGSKPTEPNTGYGYIRAGNVISEQSFTVESFVEKPNLERATEYMQQDDYYWNSGIFLCRASVYLAALKNNTPSIYQACLDAMQNLSADNTFLRPNQVSFNACPEDSIDYAIMENANNRAMVVIDLGWSDVGSWSAVADLVKSNGDIYLSDTENTYVSASSRLVAAIGVKDVAIVETRDAVLVVDKKSDQKVKELVSYLVKKNREEALLPSCVHRPWGTYETIEESVGFKVKRITVKPGARLSLQMHHHRSEHWIVVRGEATVTSGEKTFELAQNQSTYIPPQTKHRLANYTDESLELIEVQCGSYLGEDDIVRFEDQYGRAEVVN